MVMYGNYFPLDERLGTSLLYFIEVEIQRRNFPQFQIPKDKKVKKKKKKMKRTHLLSN